MKVATIGVVLIAVAATLGASAFTTGSVDRAANVNVVSDDVGLIALQDGTSGSLVAENSTGALNVDFTNGGAAGVNTAAHFELGSPTSPTTEYAFNVTNLAGDTHDFTITYDTTAASDGNANLQYQFYNTTGDNVATVSEETTSDTITGVSPSTTYHVVVVVDTHGLDTSADLSGTLEISA